MGSRFAHDRRILVNICQHKPQRAALPLSEQISGASQLKVFLRYSESVISLLQDLQPPRLLVRVFIPCRPWSVQEYTIGLPLPSAYPASQLMFHRC